MSFAPQQSKGGLLLVGSLREYFKTSFGAAMLANEVSLSEQTSHYIVELLTLFSRSDDLYEPADSGTARKPLATMLANAMTAECNAERRFLLQRMGDIALFTAGVFPDSLQNAAVDLDYFMRMGGGAYQSLSAHLRGSSRAQAFMEVYAELAERFQDVVDVLHEMCDPGDGTAHTNVLRLYEIWLQTGSRRAGRLLRAQGILPLQQPWGDRRH